MGRRSGRFARSEHGCLTPSQNLRLRLFNEGFTKRGAANEGVHVGNGGFNPLDVHANAFEDGGLESESVGPSTARFESHEHRFLQVVVQQPTQREKRKESKQNSPVLGEGKRKSGQEHESRKHQRPERFFVSAYKGAHVGQRRRNLIHAENG